MKRKLIIVLATFCIVFTAIINIGATKAKTAETVIDTQYGCVIDGQQNKVVLLGTYNKNGIYAENVRIEVRNIKTNKTVLKINPPTNSGYEPRILLERFTDKKTEQIFLGMSSGGSGGYGYFYLFDVTGGKIKTLFDYKKWNMNYSAQYMDNYKVKVSQTDQNKSFIIDLSLRDKDYLNQIYRQDGTLIEPKNGEVSSVNTVFPYFNSSEGIFQLEVLQRITGLYNADSLGYVINLLSYKNGAFNTYFTMVGIL